MMRDRVRATLIGTDSTRWDVAGFEGSTPPQGVEIDPAQIDGIYDAPFETEWDESADGIGAVQIGGARYKARDIVLGFHIFDDEYSSSAPGEAESAFRKAFPTQRDPWDDDFTLAQLWIESSLSGTRKLYVQAHEAPEVPLNRDPLRDEYFNVKYLLRAGQPLWDSGEVMKFFQSSSTSASGTIEVANPTDMPMRQTWRLTRATWTLPDPSWSGAAGKRVPGGAFPSRTLPLPPILDTDGGVVITRDRAKLHATTFTGANFLVRMQGKWLQFDIPPYTPKTLLPISYTDAPAGGARAELYQPRLWSRPWGLH